VKNPQTETDKRIASFWGFWGNLFHQRPYPWTTIFHELGGHIMLRRKMVSELAEKIPQFAAVSVCGSLCASTITALASVGTEAAVANGPNL